MSELVPARERTNCMCRSNSSEPIMPSVLLNMTSVSTVVGAPVLINLRDVFGCHMAILANL